MPAVSPVSSAHEVVSPRSVSLGPRPSGSTVDVFARTLRCAPPAQAASSVTAYASRPRRRVTLGAAATCASLVFLAAIALWSKSSGPQPHAVDERLPSRTAAAPGSTVQAPAPTLDRAPPSPENGPAVVSVVDSTPARGPATFRAKTVNAARAPSHPAGATSATSRRPEIVRVFPGD
jgi:hypothetical protein